MSVHSAVGKPVQDLDTPALLLDLDTCQSNLTKMASFFSERPAKLRPHFKNHKCTRLARLQLDTGSAVGITCARLDEAEVLVQAGFNDVLIANQVVGVGKVRRLAGLAENSKITVAIDDVSQAKSIAAAAKEAGVTIGLLLEVDIGMQRCGVSPGKPALELVQQVVDLPHIEFRGLQAYEGHLVGISNREAREVQVQDAFEPALETRALLERHGIATPTISGCSTSTYQYSGILQGVTEVQAGSYATMDWFYHQLAQEFDIALSILATVISCQPDRAVLDTGIKCIGDEFGLPQIKNMPEVEIPFFGSEEHCVVQKASHWKIGDTVEVHPSHCCSTCNLHPQMFVHQQGTVVDVWPIDGRSHVA